jgi:putative ABC transport system permease protein
MRLIRFIVVTGRSAASVLFQNRVRSVLTVAICGSGVAGVTIAGTLAEINAAEMRRRFDTLGGNLLVISPNRIPPLPGRPRQLDHFISLLPEDAAAIQTLSGGVVVPLVAREAAIRANTGSIRVRLVGTTRDYLSVRSFRLEHGRFFDNGDDGRRVIVLGSAVSRELSPDGIVPGQTVLVANSPYTVIGVLQPQGINFAGEDEDHQAFVPLTTYQQRIANRSWLTTLYVQVPLGTDAAPVVRRIQSHLRERHGRWDYQVDDTVVRNLADVSARQSDLLTTVAWVVTVTSILLLLTGMAGIAALMLLAVRQRRGEIGLRRALGATGLDIALQFFIEGITLAGAGVLGGAAFGFVTSLVAVRALDAPPLGESVLPLLAVCISFSAALLACTIPAVIAARLEPSVAIQEGQTSQ